MIFSLLIFIPIVVIVLIVFIIAGIRISSDKGGDDVIKNVYVYLVLFATLMMTIGGSVGIFMAVADIVAPAPYYQSFEEFKRWGGEKIYPEQEVKEEKPSEEELLERYEAMLAAEKERRIEQAKNSLIKSFGWVVIPFPVFIYFQRRLVNREV